LVQYELWLSVRIFYDKAGQTADLERSKSWIFLPGIGSPGKVGNNRIQVVYQIDIPNACFLGEDCDFVITVDSGNVVGEFNEVNNVVIGRCSIIR